MTHLETHSLHCTSLKTTNNQPGLQSTSSAAIRVYYIATPVDTEEEGQHF